MRTVEIPLDKINAWLSKEKALGSPNPAHFVLATVSPVGRPHSRVMRMREITHDGIIFFTQKETTKVKDLSSNQFASLTFWLPLQSSEMIFDGFVELLSHEENQHYWTSLPRKNQLRFMVNTIRNHQPHLSVEELQAEQAQLTSKFEQKVIPMVDDYVGYRFTPERIIFYTYSEDEFSEIDIVQ
jgi:pyridoxamine 5'-phosphate oxidase